MRKSSKSISLALIGSAFLVGGCSGPAAEDSGPEWAADDEVVRAGAGPNEQAVATGTDQYHHDRNMHHSSGRVASGVVGGLIGSHIGRSMGGGSTVAPGYGGRPGGGGGGGGASSAPSARGGFGSSAGHASASS